MKYCFRSQLRYSMWRLGRTPSWITRVRKEPGVLLVTMLLEDELHAVRSPEIHVVANDLLGELPSSHGLVEDLRQAHFHLPDRELPVVSSRPLFLAQRHRKTIEPAGEKRLDVGSAQLVASPASFSGFWHARNRCPVPRAHPSFSSCRLAHSCPFRQTFSPHGA